MSDTSVFATDRSAYQGTTILAKGHELGCDTWSTGLNNNVLVIGPSGSGKTRHFLKPNLLQMSSSFITLDTKGTLCREVGPVLAAHGYDVLRLNFADLGDCGACSIEGARDAGFDPLRHVRFDPITGRPNQQDILSVATALSPTSNEKEPFWEHMGAQYLAYCIAYVLERLPKEEQTLSSVIALVNRLGEKDINRLFEDLEVSDPESLAFNIHRRAMATQDSPVTNGSVLATVSEKVLPLGFDAALALYENPNQIDFARMGHERVALFVTVSDIDRSLDALTSLFVVQALSELVREADRCEGGRLPVPVRLFLDDFANLYIAHFDDTLSVIRSREIWCTLLLQSFAQLEERYGRSGATSIVGNCDEQLVLSFQDVDTASAFRERADCRPASLMETPREKSWLFLRGEKAQLVEHYELTEHPRYGELPEARGRIA